MKIAYLLIPVLLIGLCGAYTLPGHVVKGNIDLYGNKVINASSPVNDTDLSTKGYVDSVVGVGYLPLSGGTLTGWLNLSSFPLQSVGMPSNDTDASTKLYVDNIKSSLQGVDLGWYKINKSGDSMTGPLGMSGYKIESLGNGTANQDCAAYSQLLDASSPTSTIVGPDTDYNAKFYDYVYDGTVGSGDDVINLALAHENATVLLMPSNYTIDNSIVMANNTVLMGFSKINTTIYCLQPGLDCDNAITNENRVPSGDRDHDITIRDLTIDCNGLAQDTAGIQFYSHGGIMFSRVENVTVENVVVKNAQGFSIMFGRLTGDCSQDECENVLVHNCDVLRDSALLTHRDCGGGEITNARFIDNYCYNMHGAGFTTGGAKNWLLQGNIYNTSDDCVNLEAWAPVEDIIIDNCQMKTGLTGFLCYVPDTAGEQDGYINNVIMSNCNVESDQYAGVISDGMGNTIGKVQNVSFVDCSFNCSGATDAFRIYNINSQTGNITFRNIKSSLGVCTYKHIYSQAARDITVEGCTFNGGGAAFNAVGIVENLNFIGNRCAGLQYSGVYGNSPGAFNNSIVSNNRFVDVGLSVTSGFQSAIGGGDGVITYSVISGNRISNNRVPRTMDYGITLVSGSNYNNVMGNLVTGYTGSVLYDAGTGNTNTANTV